MNIGKGIDKFVFFLLVLVGVLMSIIAALAGFLIYILIF